MTAEEYVVQQLQEAEEKIRELEEANHYLACENAKKLADLKTLVNLFEIDEDKSNISAYIRSTQRTLFDGVKSIILEYMEVGKK